MLRVSSAETRSRAAFLAARFLELCPTDFAFSSARRKRVADLDETSGQLRSAIARYTTVLRELGEPPERVIILVKEFASEVSHSSGIEDGEGREAISSEFVRWTIEAYYSME
jgi:hypothetical protein